MMRYRTRTDHDGIFYTCYEDLRKEAAWTVHIREVVEEWTKRGEDVTLFIPKIYPFTHPPRCRVVPVPTINVRFVREYLYLFLLPFYVLGHGIARRPRAVYSREMAFMPGVALACALLGIPLIMEINGFAPLDLQRIGAGRGRILFYSIMQRINLLVTTAQVFVTLHFQSLFQKRYRLNRKKIHVVHNGVDTDRFSPGDPEVAKEVLGLDGSKEYITYIGSFHPHGRAPLIVEAAAVVMKQRPGVMLLMIGDGHDRAACEAAAGRLSITENSVFTGAMPHRSIPQAIRASAVLINLVADTDDTQSMKMLEYLSCGAPVIANGATLHDVPLEAGVHYIRVGELTADAVAESLLSALTNESLARSIGAQGRELICKHFSWKKTAGRLIDIIDSTGDRRRKRS